MAMIDKLDIRVPGMHETDLWDRFEVRRRARKIPAYSLPLLLGSSTETNEPSQSLLIDIA